MAKTFTMNVSRNGAWETFYPKTVISQVVNLQNVLNGKLNRSDRGATNGVAPLENGKIPTNYLPEAALGRSQFITTLNGVNWPRDSSHFSSLGTLTQLLEGSLGKTLSASNYIDFIGCYFIVTENFYVKETTGTSGGQWLYKPSGSEGGILQNADNIIVAGYDEANNLLLYGLINNTYGYATSHSSGITRLSHVSNVPDLTRNQDDVDDVINNYTLHGLIKEGDLNGSSNEKIASSNHTHSQYQTINNHLTNIINASKEEGNFLVGNGTTFVAKSREEARASLGVYSTNEIIRFNLFKREIVYSDFDIGPTMIEIRETDGNLYFSDIVDV